MIFEYSNTNKRYHTLDYFYKKKFGRKVCKISLNAGFSCPNINKTGGCIYCSKSGSGEYGGNPDENLVKQFYSIKKIMDKKWKDCLYIGYFQAHTNTYAPLAVLKEKYETILKLDNVVGLSIATRPDAISEEVLEYLEELNKRTFLTIELGLQTMHDKTNKLLNRGHNLACFDNMVRKLKKRKIFTVAHIINGLPFENKEMMIETAIHLNNIGIDGIKIHMLCVLKQTALEKFYLKNKFDILSKDQYVDIVCSQLEYLNPKIVIQRLTTDPLPSDLIAPHWLLKKVSVLNDIDKEMVKRDSHQGKMLK